MIGKIAVFCKNMLDWFKSSRCFIRYFLDAFHYANNLLLLTLTLLAIFIVSMYMIISAQIGISPMLSLVVIILLSSVLASGFFYFIKNSIDIVSDGESFDKSNIKQTMSAFYTGVGEHYLSFLGVFILFFILASILVIATVILADRFICPINQLGIDIRDFFIVLADPNQVEVVKQNLSIEQQTNLRYWCRLFLFTTQTFTFLIMFWIPEILFTKKNIVVSLFKSIKRVILDFPSSLCVYLTIMLLNYILAVIIVVLGRFSMIVFILNIASLYLLIYNFYAIFLYYKGRFVEDRGWIA